MKPTLSVKSINTKFRKGNCVLFQEEPYHNSKFSSASTEAEFEDDDDSPNTVVDFWTTAEQSGVKEREALGALTETIKIGSKQLV